MSNVENYNMKIEVIKAITDDQINPPYSIPVKTYIQEAETLYTWCQVDKEQLISKGLDWTVVEDLPIRCGALREAQSNWKQVRLLRAEDEKIWMREAPNGYDLRNEMVHHFRFAFRDCSWLVLKVNAISKKITHTGMIEGLKDLDVLGRKNRELLTNIGFDLTLLDKAAQKSDELAALYAAASWDREDYREAKKIRDQAYTHLKEACNLICQCGQYVFWRNPSRFKGYRSNYLRKIRLRSNARKSKIRQREREKNTVSILTPT